MECLYCKAGGTRVVNSRTSAKGASTWRRRKCAACGRIFTTHENADHENLSVTKRNGSRQRFMYEKLFASVFVALNARKDRDNGRDAKMTGRVVHAVLADLHTRFAKDGTVTTRTIILLTHAHLKKLRQSFADNYVYYSDYRFHIARGSRT